jgi:hypothetical protein
MKHSFSRPLMALGLFAGVATFAPSAYGVVVAQYQFGTPGQETATETSPAFSPTTTAPGTTATAVTDPNSTIGIEISSAPAGTTVPTGAPFLRIDPQGSSADPASASTNNKYFQFSVGASSGFDVDLTNLTFNVARGGAGTPRGFFIRTSADNFATELPVTGSPAFTANGIGNDVTTARPTYSLATADLSAAGFQNIQNLTGSGLTFRVYAYSPGGGSSIDFDDFTVNGNISAIPEPASLVLAAAGAPLLLGRRRRRRRD